MDGKTTRSLLAVVTLLLAVQQLESAEPALPTEKRPAWPALIFRPLRIAPETTYFTGPLDEHGDVDYLAALNQHYSQGVTQENNAVVPLLQAFGPCAIREEHRAAMYAALGMKPLPEQGNFFQSFEQLIDEILEREYRALLEKAKQEGRSADSVKMGDPKLRRLFRHRTPEIEVQLRAETRRPWRSEESPIAAAWLKRNEPPLKLLADLPNRRRWYAPFGGMRQPDKYQLNVAFWTAVDQRMAWSAAEALAIRCRLHLGENRPAEACRDAILAVHLAQAQMRSCVYDNVYDVARANEWSLAAMESVLEDVPLTSKEARRMLAELGDADTLPTLGDCIGPAERCSVMATLPLLAKYGLSTNWRELDDATLLTMSLRSQVESFATPCIVDWETVAASATRYCDALERAAAIPGSIERRKAIEKILPPNRDTHFEGRYREMQRIVEKNAFLSFDPISCRRLLTRRVAEQVIEGQAFDFYFDDRGRGNYVSICWSRRAIRIGLALAAYRHDHGKFPETLDKIAPDYLKSVPFDPCTNMPLCYRRTGAGYLLYSVGDNGRDDGGAAYVEDPRCDKEKTPKDADDIVLQVSGSAYAPQ